MQRKHCV